MNRRRIYHFAHRKGTQLFIHGMAVFPASFVAQARPFRARLSAAPISGVRHSLAAHLLLQVILSIPVDPFVPEAIVISIMRRLHY